MYKDDESYGAKGYSEHPDYDEEKTDYLQKAYEMLPEKAGLYDNGYDMGWDDAIDDCAKVLAEKLEEIDNWKEFEPGTTRECGHFVQFILSYCPMCQLQAELQAIRQDTENKGEQCQK